MPPLTPILDDFGRADSPTLGANWSVLQTIAGTGRFGIASNSCKSQVGLNQVETWNPSTFGPDCEVWCEVVILPAEPNIMGLALRASGSPWNGYLCQFIANVIRITRVDAGVTTVLGTFSLGSTITGLLFRAEGDRLSAHVIEVATWEEVLVVNNAVYADAGSIGLRLPPDDAAGTRVDHFGGGSLDAPAGGGLPPFRRHRSHRGANFRRR